MSVARENREEALGAGRTRRDVALGVLAAVLAVAIAATALLASTRFFLTDDYATYFMPGFREIARLLGEGKFPLLTDRIWNGGALLQEYQYAVFNPVSMLLYVVLGHLDDLAAAAAVYSLVHIGILAGGAFFLCRVLGCAPRHAFLAAVLAPLSDWIFYWGAADWIPALVSMAWLVWAWGFLSLTFRRPAFAPAAALAVAMTLLSGWPFTDLAFLISILVAAEVFLAAGRPWRLRPATWFVVALTAGACLAAPAILPLYSYVARIARPPDIGLWAADVPALLGVGVPNYMTHWRFDPGGMKTVYKPMVYVAWFAPLALANADWLLLKKSGAGLLVMAAAGAFAALSMFPAFWQFRWMFRLLPYYQLAILILASLALSQLNERASGWRTMPTLLVVVAAVWLAMCQAPALRLIYLGMGIGLATAAWIGARLVRRRGFAWTLFALAVSVGAFQVTLWTTVVKGYPQVPNGWTPPTKFVALGPAGETGPSRFAIIHAPTNTADPGAAFWRTYAPGNITLDRPGAGIIGYTSLTSPPLYDRFCEGHFGAECADVVARVTAPAAPTGRGVLDLMSVDEVTIQQARDSQAFAAWAGTGWTQARGPAGEWRFNRIRPLGLVTWASPGAAAVVQSSAPSRITAQARNDAPSPATIVLARAWYPRWSASLNGAPLVARPLAGLLVSVQLPPHSTGRLQVSFWPAGLTEGLVLAALGVLLLVSAALFPRLIEVPIEKLSAALEPRAKIKNAPARRPA